MQWWQGILSTSSSLRNTEGNNMNIQIFFNFGIQTETIANVTSIRKFYCNGSFRYFYEVVDNGGSIKEYHADSVKEIVIT
jgi:hypothetical protein